MYKQKYLKYKEKYIELRKLKRGGEISADGETNGFVLQTFNTKITKGTIEGTTKLMGSVPGYENFSISSPIAESWNIPLTEGTHTLPLWENKIKTIIQLVDKEKFELYNKPDDRIAREKLYKERIEKGSIIGIPENYTDKLIGIGKDHNGWENIEISRTWQSSSEQEKYEYFNAQKVEAKLQNPPIKTIIENHNLDTTKPNIKKMLTSIIDAYDNKEKSHVSLTEFAWIVDKFIDAQTEISPDRINMMIDRIIKAYRYGIKTSEIGVMVDNIIIRNIDPNTAYENAYASKRPRQKNIKGLGKILTLAQKNEFPNDIRSVMEQNISDGESLDASYSLALSNSYDRKNRAMLGLNRITRRINIYPTIIKHIIESRKENILRIFSHNIGGITLSTCSNVYDLSTIKKYESLYCKERYIDNTEHIRISDASDTITVDIGQENKNLKKIDFDMLLENDQYPADLYCLSEFNDIQLKNIYIPNEFTPPPPESTTVPDTSITTPAAPVASAASGASLAPVIIGKQAFVESRSIEKKFKLKRNDEDLADTPDNYIIVINIHGFVFSRQTSISQFERAAFTYKTIITEYSDYPNVIVIGDLNTDMMKNTDTFSENMDNLAKSFDETKRVKILPHIIEIKYYYNEIRNTFDIRTFPSNVWGLEYTQDDKNLIKYNFKNTDPPSIDNISRVDGFLIKKQFMNDLNYQIEYKDIQKIPQLSDDGYLKEPIQFLNNDFDHNAIYLKITLYGGYTIDYTIDYT